MSNIQRKDLCVTANALRARLNTMDPATELKKANAALGEAGENALNALSNVGGAVVNTAQATGHAAQGTVDLMEAGATEAAAGLVGAGAVLANVSEALRSAAAFVLKNVTSAFTSVGDFFNNDVTATVRSEAADPSKVRTSEKLFQTMINLDREAGNDLGDAFDQYFASLSHLGGAGVNLGVAALDVGAAAVNVAEAAGHVTVAATQELAQLGLLVAAASLDAAEAGMDTAGDLTLLAAKVTAEAHNAVNNVDQGDISVDVGAFRQQALALGVAEAG